MKDRAVTSPMAANWTSQEPHCTQTPSSRRFSKMVDWKWFEPTSSFSWQIVFCTEKSLFEGAALRSPCII